MSYWTAPHTGRETHIVEGSAMMELLGKVVTLTEVSYVTATRDGVPFEFEYSGRVAKVDGHMIKIIDCQIEKQPFSFPHPGTRWFNTMASTFKSIGE